MSESIEETWMDLVARGFAVIDENNQIHLTEKYFEDERKRQQVSAKSGSWLYASDRLRDMTATDHEKYINRNLLDRFLYRVLGKHKWLYNKDRTRRWCNISDEQHVLRDGKWVLLDQPKRQGFI